MRATPSRLLATTAIVALAAMLGACAQPQPEATTAPERPESTPTASATPSGSATTTADPAAEGVTGVATPPATVELVDFETQNGTMRLRMPEDWSVEDRSAIALQGDERQGWNNELWFSAPNGGGLGYSDGFWGDTGAEATETVTLERVAVGHGLSAAAWWERFEDDRYSVGVAVVMNPDAPFHLFKVGDGTRLRSLAFHHPDAEQGFASREAAEAYLGSPAVALALDAMATVEFLGDEDAIPEGVGVVRDGTTYLPYTTPNGSASFLVPQAWWIRDWSASSTNSAGQQVWNNAITVGDLDGGAMLGYYDTEFTNYVEDLEWVLGEVRPTQTEGWQAVSWGFGDSVPSQGGYVGVSLSDRNGTVRPADRVCSERMCRDFSSLPLDPGGFDPKLTGPEDFFGSQAEEQMLTVVASLETHHDDPTRMP